MVLKFEKALDLAIDPHIVHDATEAFADPAAVARAWTRPGGVGNP